MKTQPHDRSVPTVFGQLYEQLLMDNPLKLPQIGVQRDISTLLTRVSAEGHPFVTKLLPTLGKALEAGLESGQLLVPSGFRRAHNSMLPAFLQDAFRIIFDDQGDLRPFTPALPPAIQFIRQVAYLVHKVEFGYTKEDKLAKQVAYIVTDSLLPEEGAFEEVEDVVLDLAAREIARILPEIPETQALKPRHGPGAVAEQGVQDEAKWIFQRISSQLKSSLRGLADLCYVNSRHREDEGWFQTSFGLPTPYEKHGTTVSRIAYANKTVGNPRVFAIEPMHLQWVQQALKAVLYEALPRTTYGRINFQDQTVNRALALAASYDRKMATMDLSDASDRNSWALVQAVFRHRPEYLEYFRATRSTHTQFPTGKVIRLRKFASMGSALTFPVEALTFYGLCVAGIAQVLPGRLGWIRKHVYIYGDDIVVPTRYVSVVADVLERYGLKVNRSKTFSKGHFRESCGLDAFHGYEVSVNRLKKLPPSDRKDVESIVSWAELASKMAKVGLTRTAEFLYARVESILGPLPYGVDGSGYLHRWHPGSEAGAFLRTKLTHKVRWSPTRHVMQGRVWVVEKPPTFVLLNGWPRLLRNLTQGPGDTPDYVVPRQAELVLRVRWSRLYG